MKSTLTSQAGPSTRGRFPGPTNPATHAQLPPDLSQESLTVFRNRRGGTQAVVSASADLAPDLVSAEADTTKTVSLRSERRQRVVDSRAQHRMDREAAGWHALNEARTKGVASVSEHSSRQKALVTRLRPRAVPDEERISDRLSEWTRLVWRSAIQPGRAGPRD